MFGKRGGKVDSNVDSSQFEVLKRKVDALQQKVLTSEKLQTQVFDFMASFEKRVAEIVESKLGAAGEPKEPLPKQAPQMPAEAGADNSTIEELVNTKLTEFDEALSTRFNEALTKLNSEVQANREALTELKGAVEGLPQASGAGKTEISKQLETTMMEAHTLLDELKKATESSGKPAGAGTQTSLDEFETRLTSKLNEALSTLHKQVDTTNQELTELKAKMLTMDMASHSNRKHPEIDDAKSVKLTMQQKLQELANEIDVLHTEMASSEYVAILETEFRNRLEELASRINAIDAFGYPKAAEHHSLLSSVAEKLTNSQLKKFSKQIRELEKKAASKDELLRLKKELHNIVMGMNTEVKGLTEAINSIDKSLSALSKGKLLAAAPKKGVREIQAELKQAASKEDVARLGKGLNALDSELNQVIKAVRELQKNQLPALKPGKTSDKQLTRAVSALYDQIAQISKEVEGLKAMKSQAVKQPVEAKQLEGLKADISLLNSRLEGIAKQVSRAQPEQENMLKKQLAEQKQELSRIWQELEYFIASVVKVEQLNAIKRGLKEINKKVDTLSGAVESFDNNLKGVLEVPDIRAVHSSINNMAEAIAKLNKKLDTKTNDIRKEFDEFKSYSVEQLEHTLKWINYIKEALK